ncbi:MAG: sn-glycerol-1-phosphate dehydrogenase [Eubacteriales bacterium]|nr:sn-glycerol-1-phosphate dehydrogenase [Eubacteriales bacterium]
MDLNNYINKELPCDCGKNHFFSIKVIDINPDATKRLPEHLKEMGYERPFLVEDKNTYEAAGKALEEVLVDAGFPVEKHILDYDEMVPDEAVIGEVVCAFNKKCDIIVAVGSGTINDLCKFVSYQMSCDYMIFATAPSMDGFVSNGAAMIVNHVKVSFDCRVPVAVVGDTEVLRNAPMNMINAGLADTLGKYTCLLDWKLSALINDEYYCDQVTGMVEEALRTVMSQKDLIAKRDANTIKSVTEALVLTGIAMALVGYSRPASGCEHHLSHLWEMRFLMEGKKAILHGTKVGVGMITALHMYQDLAKEEVDFETAKQIHFDQEAYEAKMKEVYKDAAPGVIALEKKCGKNADEARFKRVAVMEEKWDEIKKLINENLPAAEEMEELLGSLGGTIRPAQIDISEGLLYEGICYAKEVRDRYTLLGILGDLGLSEKYARKMVEYYKNN